MPPVDRGHAIDRAIQERQRLTDTAAALWGDVRDCVRLGPSLSMSGRRYYLLTFLLTSTPPAPQVLASVAPQDKTRQFVLLQKFLTTHGIPVPDVFDCADWCEDGVVFQEYLTGPSLMSVNDKVSYLKTLVDIACQLAELDIPSWATDQDLLRRYDGTYIQSRLATLVRPVFESTLRRPLTADEHGNIAAGLRALGRSADSLPFALAHRDLQSSNVIIQDRVPHLIDFQSASLAPLGFDIACLLYDSYVTCTDSLRQDLLERFVSRTGGTLTPAHFTGLATYRKLFDVANFLDAQIRMGIDDYKPYLATTAAMVADLWSSGLGSVAGGRMRSLLTEVVEHALA